MLSKHCAIDGAAFFKPRIDHGVSLRLPTLAVPLQQRATNSNAQVPIVSKHIIPLSQATSSYCTLWLQMGLTLCNRGCFNVDDHINDYLKHSNLDFDDRLYW